MFGAQRQCWFDATASGGPYSISYLVVGAGGGGAAGGNTGPGGSGGAVAAELRVER